MQMQIQGHDHAFFAPLFAMHESTAEFEAQIELCFQQAYIGGELDWDFKVTKHDTLLQESMWEVDDLPDDLFDLTRRQVPSSSYGSKWRISMMHIDMHPDFCNAHFGTECSCGLESNQEGNQND